MGIFYENMGYNKFYGLEKVFLVEKNKMVNNDFRKNIFFLGLPIVALVYFLSLFAFLLHCMTFCRKSLHRLFMCKLVSVTVLTWTTYLEMFGK